MKPLIVYHGGCVDGFTAAWAAWKNLGDEADYHPGHYGPNGLDLPNVTGRDVTFVDLCPRRRVLIDLQERANSVLVLDHHKTAMEECGDLSCCLFDMERSGARIAWDHFVGGPRPWLVDYVEDRDLWRWALPESKEVSAYISTVTQDFKVWDGLSSHTVSLVSGRGIGILAHIDRYVEAMQKQVIRRRFAGHDDIPVVNAPYINASELVGKCAEDSPFAVGWFQRSDMLFQYSLRSRGENGADVSAIAKQFGGGGHRNAAGFVSCFTPWSVAVCTGDDFRE